MSTLNRSKTFTGGGGMKRHAVERLDRSGVPIKRGKKNMHKITFADKVT